MPLRSSSLALLVQATHAQLTVYRSVAPHVLHGLPVYFLWPAFAARMRGDSIIKLLLVMVMKL